MAIAKSSTEKLSSISEARAKLAAQMAQLDQAEKRVRDAERDAGRKVFLSALGKVKIAQISREDAVAIAAAIGTLPAAEIIAALGPAMKAKPAPETAS